ncbi:MAG: hypothetical protein LBT52_07000 [Clostridiales Family XIII bacterium]|nr:hypothetical protein [Clostridiales Family XIII bacterium]
MIHFSKYHGCGNDFIIIDEAELARADLVAAGLARADLVASGLAHTDLVASGLAHTDCVASGLAHAGSVASALGGGTPCRENADDAHSAHSTRSAHSAHPTQFTLSALAKALCHRQLGVGADGLIVVRRNPLTMDILNSDGSVAPMCGNGIRCFARYCLEKGIVPEGTEEFDVNTLAGVMPVRVSFAGGFDAEIGMGRPDWSARAAGIEEDGTYLGRTVAVEAGRVNGSEVTAGGMFDGGAAVDGSASGGAVVDDSALGGAVVDDSVSGGGVVDDSASGGAVAARGGGVASVRLSSFFLGTYHTVVWLDENEWILRSASGGDDREGQSSDAAADGDSGSRTSTAKSVDLYTSEAIDRIGRILESHPVFTQRTNVNFARVVDRNTVEMITWERGAGLTAACGTGASSVVALGLREGRIGPLASGASSNPACSGDAKSEYVGDADSEYVGDAKSEYVGDADSRSVYGAGSGNTDGAGSGCMDGIGTGNIGDAEVSVRLPYGVLCIRQEPGGEIFMKGPAEHVFDGEYYYTGRQTDAPIQPNVSLPA